MARSPFHLAAALRNSVRTAASGLLLAASLAPLWTRIGAAQAAPAANPQTSTAVHGYDVVSIKPNKSGSGGMRLDAYDTTFNAENVSLKWLLANAFGIRDSLISGLPPWASSLRWDIRAKVVDPDPGLKDRKQTRAESAAEFQAKTQGILHDRFQLKSHMETVTAPIFDLVLAKGGSKLKPADKADEGHGSMGVHNQTLTATYLPVSSLLQFLGGETGRNVEDKTGLTGNYNMELKWSREDQSVNGTDNGSADKPPTLFTALEEQLGLKLVPDKGPVATLVVDSVEMPTAD